MGASSPAQLIDCLLVTGRSKRANRDHGPDHATTAIRRAQLRSKGARSDDSDLVVPGFRLSGDIDGHAAEGTFNPKVVGSNPTGPTDEAPGKRDFCSWSRFAGSSVGATEYDLVTIPKKPLSGQSDSTLKRPRGP